MKIAPCTFIVATDVAIVADVTSAFESSNQKPEFIVVLPTQENSKLGIVSYNALTPDLAQLQLLQHPDLQTNIGQVSLGASAETREQAVSDHGMAVVLVRKVPVEVLRTQFYGEEFRLQPGLPIPELECSNCKKRSRPMAIISKGGSILYCARCGAKWQ